MGPSPRSVAGDLVIFGEVSLDRLDEILTGLKLEIKFPGMRMTRKAPKCSTILRKEFGLSGKPEGLFFALLVKHDIIQAMEDASAGAVIGLRVMSFPFIGLRPGLDLLYLALDVGLAANVYALIRGLAVDHD